MRAITRAMLPVLLALTLVEIGSGLVLDTFEATLQRAPSLLVLVPVVIGTAGNLGSILASRLSTALHLGLFSFAPDDETLVGNAVATVALAASIFPIVGAGAWALTVLTVPGGAEILAGVVCHGYRSLVSRIDDATARTGTMAVGGYHLSGGHVSTRGEPLLRCRRRHVVTMRLSIV